MLPPFLTSCLASVAQLRGNASLARLAAEISPKRTVVVNPTFSRGTAAYFGFIARVSTVPFVFI